MKTGLRKLENIIEERRQKWS